MTDYGYISETGGRYARWVEAQTPAAQAEGRRLAEDRSARSAYLAYERRCYDRSAHAIWARTPEAQETAARAKTIGLFDPVPPDAGPQCPPKAPADRPLAAGDPVHRNPAAGHAARGPDAGAGGADR